ncbi:hypothetical protein HUE87_00105 [Candidatus Sulfurimonas marisnigri]|uniref:Lipoprotein n=1 Tax=Candidatus Sulfurimonas marisnigri TaxID=2740405 RepID=A0A7S7RQL6_9BACT|nr:hypothetical protein [Candidatus Sulfurimonas marisnigri]QOY54688.1 hypothetical protein HUE87_00105 [Candidatus Sulfurimonas marisnigri]
MKKYIFISGFLITVLFGGCSYFKFNAAMCDQIAKEPNAVIPQECRNYSEADAQKAFDKKKVKSSTNLKDELEFHKEEK